jgi:hypothetical protein
MLPRRYVVYRDDQPLLSVKFIPRGWPFAVDDIQRTIHAYSDLESVRVPRVLGNITFEDGHFLIDEYLAAPRSLEQLIGGGAVTVDDGARMIQSVLEEVWERSEA